MGCTPPPQRAKDIPPVNAQPSRIQLKSVTSIEEIMKQEAYQPSYDIGQLDIKMEDEYQNSIAVPKMDFENK